MPREDEHIYRSFLLRYWVETAETGAAAPTWRFALQSVADAAERHEFGSLAALNMFIAAKLAAAAPDSRGGSDEARGNEKQ